MKESTAELITINKADGFESSDDSQNSSTDSQP